MVLVRGSTGTIIDFIYAQLLIIYFDDNTGPRYAIFYKGRARKMGSSRDQEK
jgi:hypothetical protein